MTRLEHAIDLAKKSHRFQFRKFSEESAPYIVHPARVAMRVSLLENTSEDMICAAWLHDVLEDTSTTLEQIERETSPAIVSLVEQLTNPPKEAGLSRSARKALDRFRLQKVSVAAKRIKMCDRIDNIYDFGGATADFKEIYLRESELLLEVIGSADDKLAKELRSVIDAMQEHGKGKVMQ